VVWIFFPEMGLNEESEVSFWKEKMGLSVDREDLGCIPLVKEFLEVIKQLNESGFECMRQLGKTLYPKSSHNSI
jgi:hypothetical protein